MKIECVTSFFFSSEIIDKKSLHSPDCREGHMKLNKFVSVYHRSKTKYEGSLVLLRVVQD